MTVVLGDILRLVAKIDIQNGTEANWVFHYEVTGGTSETDLAVLTGLRDDLDLACNTIEGDLHDSVHSTEVELFVWDAVLDRFDGTSQLGWITFDGTDAGQAFMNQQAMLVKFFTNLARRQGSKYLPPHAEPAANGNLWLAGELVNALAWSAILDDALVIGSVTVHPCTFNTDAASPLFETSELFSGVTAVDTNPSTQRKRKVGVGI